MRLRIGTWTWAAALAAGAALVSVSAVYTQQPAARAAYRAPRAPDGRPNLNGIWQAMNTAHWDIEAHSAGPSAVRDLGAAGAVPAGLGVVEGGEVPYRPEALAKKKENLANRLKLDPEIRCYLPGVPRATYMPFPFQIVQGTEARDAGPRVRRRGADDLHDRPHRPAGRQLDGLVERTLGGGEPGRRHEGVQRPDAGSTAPATSTAMRCTWSNGSRRAAPTRCSTRPPSRIRRCSRGRGR